MSEKNWGAMNPEVPTNPESKFRATVNELDRILTYRVELVKTFGVPGLDNIENAYRFMRGQMELLGEDKGFVKRREDLDPVDRMINLLMDHAIYRNLTPIFRDIAIALTRLTRNWNDNIWQNADISRRLAVINRVVTDAKTMQDATEILRAVIERTRSTLQYEQPALKISEHYRKSLVEQVESKDEET